MKKKGAPKYLVVALLLIFLPDASLYADPELAYSCKNNSGENSSEIPFDIYLKVQSAGYIGLFVAGAGIAFRDRHIRLDILYGYVPASVSGHSAHSICSKLNIHPLKLKIYRNLFLSPLYIGCSYIRAVNSRLFVKNPYGYSDDYYRPTAFHVTANAGFEISRKTQRWRLQSFFVELSFLDDQIEMFIKNRSTVEFKDIVSVAIGFSFQV